MAASPIYFTTPGNAQVQVSAANASVATATTVTSVVAGTASGRRISRVRVAHAVDSAPAAQKVSFWLSVDNGVTKRFLCDVLLAAASAPAAGVRAGYAEVPELVGLVMQSTNTILYASVWAAQAVNISAEYNDA